LKRLELENAKIQNELKKLESDHVVFVQAMYPLYILEKVRHQKECPPHAWETTRFHPNVTIISIGIENVIGLQGIGILNHVFDIVCTLVLKYNYCKLDTANNCFHVAVNLFSTDDQGFLIPSKNINSKQVMEFATELIKSCKNIKIKIGIDTNTCYSGLVGTRFVVFGDSLKNADQLQIESQPGCINASQSTLDLIKRRRSFSADDVLNREKLSNSWKLIATSAMNAIKKKEHNSSSSNLIKCTNIESSRDRTHSFA
jgi:hypothetical protein